MGVTPGDVLRGSNYLSLSRSLPTHVTCFASPNLCRSLPLRIPNRNMPPKRCQQLDGRARRGGGRLLGRHDWRGGPGESLVPAQGPAQPGAGNRGQRVEGSDDGDQHPGVRRGLPGEQRSRSKLLTPLLGVLVSPSTSLLFPKRAGYQGSCDACVTRVCFMWSSSPVAERQLPRSRSSGRRAEDSWKFLGGFLAQGGRGAAANEEWGRNRNHPPAGKPTFVGNYCMICPQAQFTFPSRL